jgi:hypothetical protein
MRLVEQVEELEARFSIKNIIQRIHETCSWDIRFELRLLAQKVIDRACAKALLPTTN